MNYITMLILLMISSMSIADIIVPDLKAGRNSAAVAITAPNGVINRDRRTDASSAVLLGIVTDDTDQIVDPEMVDVPPFESHDVDHGLGDGLIINDPAYADPQTSIEESK